MADAVRWIDGAELDAAILGVLAVASHPRTAGQVARADHLERRAGASARSASLRRLVEAGKVQAVDRWDGSRWCWTTGYVLAGEEVVSCSASPSSLP